MSSRYLEVEGLSCTADGRLLFSDMSFSLDKGSLTTVRGANGSGKSCLLRSLCGVASQGISQGISEGLRTSGRVRYRGRSTTFPELAFEAMLIGHRAPFLKALSLFDNLSFWAKTFSPREHKQTLPAAARLFALEDFWHAPLSRLSAGEQQRGALAMLALKPQASLWLLDEPQVALDAEATERLHRCLLVHLERGGVIIVATHENLPAALQDKACCNLTLATAQKAKQYE